MPLALTQLAQQVDGIDLARLLSTASPALLLAVLIIAMASGKIVWARELTDRDTRIAKLEKENDEYKALAFGALKATERAVSVAERDRQ